MPASSDKIFQLRHLLAESSKRGRGAGNSVFVTELDALDKIGIPRGAVSEIVAVSGHGPGGSLLLYGLLHAALGRGERVILIDGKTSFAPKGLPQAELNRLLWVRCREAGQALKTADLAVRDGNVPLIVVLLTLNGAAELRRIPATAWQRLQLLAEKSGVTLLAFTPRAQIGCARLRVSVSGSFPLTQLQTVRDELVAGLSMQVERRRTIGRDDDDELRRAVCA
jgi:hypothetical protein